MNYNIQKKYLFLGLIIMLQMAVFQSRIISLFFLCFSLLANNIALAGPTNLIQQLPKHISEKLVCPEPLLTSDSELTNSTDYLKFLHHFSTGDSLFNRGEFPSAIDFYSEAYNLSEKHDDPWIQALVLNRMGFVKYWSLDFTYSDRYYTKAAQLISSESVLKDTLLAVETEVFGYLNNYKTSEKTPQQRIRFSQLLESGYAFKNERQMKYKILLAMFASNESEIDILKENIFSADAILNSMLEVKYPWVFLVNYFKLNYYLRSGEIETTQKKYLVDFYYLTQSEPAMKPYEYYILSDLVFVQTFHFKGSNEHDLVAILEKYVSNRKSAYFYYDFLTLGEYWMSQGKYDKAERYYAESEKLLLDNNIYDDRLAYIYITKGWFYEQAMQDKTKSIESFLYAENLLNRFPNVPLEIFIKSSLARLYVSIGHYTEAIERCNYVLSDLETVLDNPEQLVSNFLEQRSLEYLPALNTKVFAYRKLALKSDTNLTYLLHSRESSLEAIKLSQALFHNQSNQDSKIDEIDNQRLPINSLLVTNSLIYRKTRQDSIVKEMFRVSEAGKSFFTKYHLSDETAKKLAGIPEEEIEVARKMRIEIDSLQYTLYNSDQKLNTSNNQLLTAVIIRKSDEMEAFNDELKRKYPRYAQLRNTNSKINIADIQNKLSKSQVILEYNYSMEYLITFLLSKDTLLLNQQKLEMPFHKLVLDYRELLERSQFGGFNLNELRRFDSLSTALYSSLILPFEKECEGKELIIVPDEELTYIPFETLIKPRLAGTELPSYSDFDYLIKNHAISYLYAATQILDEVKELPGKVDYAGFSPDYSLPPVLQNINSEHMLQPLPGALEEVKNAKKFFHGEVYSGRDANRKNFFKACKKSDILHLAMHSLIDEKASPNSKLLFSSDIDNPGDYVRFYEVYSNPINAQMVILSACNTGLGDFKRGEGLLSIANAFIRGGVKNVIYTQWSVSDKASSLIMQKFYEKLAEGLPSNIALQQAKLDYLATGDPLKAHPYYWSGYLQMGSSIQLSTRRVHWFIIIGIFSAVIVVLLVTYQRRKKLRLKSS